jgi:ATP-dependent RNA helicase DeaD
VKLNGTRRPGLNGPCRSTAGTSAGAVNAVALAVFSANFNEAVKKLDLDKLKKLLEFRMNFMNEEATELKKAYEEKDAEEITVQPKEESQPKITQYMLETSGRNKLSDLAQIIIGEGYKRVMVFCDTKFNTAALANQLARLGFSVDCLHGDLSQNERNRIMQNFRDGKLNVLVATDVAARGIDVSDVDAVINYDEPADEADDIYAAMYRLSKNY